MQTASENNQGITHNIRLMAAHGRRLAAKDPEAAGGIGSRDGRRQAAKEQERRGEEKRRVPFLGTSSGFSPQRLLKCKRALLLICTMGRSSLYSILRWFNIFHILELRSCSSNICNSASAAVTIIVL